MVTQWWDVSGQDWDTGGSSTKWWGLFTDSWTNMYLVFVWPFAVELWAAVVHDGPAVVQHHPKTQTHLKQVTHAGKICGSFHFSHLQLSEHIWQLPRTCSTYSSYLFFLCEYLSIIVNICQLPESDCWITDVSQSLVQDQVSQSTQTFSKNSEEPWGSMTSWTMEVSPNRTSSVILQTPEMTPQLLIGLENFRTSSVTFKNSPMTS